MRIRALLAPLTLAVVALAADLNPKAITITPPDKIKWVDEAIGARQAVLAGDPNKPGIYVLLIKWLPNKMSRPHFHANDRYITVISGTWWVGTGAKFDPASLKPVKAGSYVLHNGKEIHYDGAKDEEVTLEIVGMGPATSIDAEQK